MQGGVWAKEEKEEENAELWQKIRQNKLLKNIFHLKTVKKVNALNDKLNGAFVF